MFDKLRIKSLLQRIEDAISLILDNTLSISSPNDFLTSSEGMFALSGACMQLIFIGESVKVIDNKTNHSYLNKYPNVPWSEIMGLRDIIAHEYHHIDSEEIFKVIKDDLPSLLVIVRQMREDKLTLYTKSLLPLHFREDNRL